MKLFYQMLSLLTTSKILLSGNPLRIAKHLIRRQAHKELAKVLRKL